jgi:23S rRNA (adenine2503-C2)-methyltransferase
VNLLDLVPSHAAGVLAGWLRDRGEPAYRERQLLPRLWERPVRRWEEATDLPAPLRDTLDRTFPLPRPVERARQVSRDGTTKFLWEFADGAAIESVLIPEGRRRTLCISSQEGCAYGCAFCATGRMGFRRHLDTWEITAQVREMALDPAIGKPTNVVFMGMGEPLHNWKAVDRALTILNAPRGLGIGARHITVSTVGVVPALRALAARPEQFRVALSLHAATPALRLRLMPVERRFALPQVLDVLRRFPKRVTFEYVMIEGVNDRDEDAEALAELAQPLGALVNLLPLHPGGAPGMAPTRAERIEAFAELLRVAGVSVTVRRSRGLDIAAACGQLRTESERQRGVATQVHADGEQ